MMGSAGLDCGNETRERQIETGDEREAEEERALANITREFPDYEPRRVFGGWLLYPKGAAVVMSTTARGALDKLRAVTAEHRPAEGIAYSVQGPNTGLPANLAHARHFPVWAVCAACREVITLSGPLRQWEHTGRMAGDPS
jgi:hypothetical protein